MVRYYCVVVDARSYRAASLGFASSVPHEQRSLLDMLMQGEDNEHTTVRPINQISTSNNNVNTIQNPFILPDQQLQTISKVISIH